jgi:hypothetical protein
LSNTNNVLSVVPQEEGFWGEKLQIQERMVEWIDFCLVARENNEDIWDLAPYLKEYKNNE